MTKILKRGIAFVITAAVLLSLLPVNMIHADAARKISISLSKKNLNISKKTTITVKNVPKGAKITVKSSKGKNLSIKKNKVKSKKTYTIEKSGTKKIVLYGRKKGTSKVSVIVKDKSGRKLAKKTFSIKIKKPAPKKEDSEEEDTPEPVITPAPEPADTLTPTNTPAPTSTPEATPSPTPTATASPTAAPVINVAPNYIPPITSSAPAKRTYTVSFDSNGGSDVVSQSIEERQYAEQPSNPVKDGYIFAGWYKDAAHTAIYDFRTPVTSDTKLYADWNALSSGSDGADGSGSSVDIFSITGLRIDSPSKKIMATVSAKENCALVVRFMKEEDYFSEDFSQETKTYIDNGNLVASHIVAAGCDMEAVTADISGDLPEHYVAEAVLLNENGEELCNPYSNIDHTVRHETFDAKTTDSFSDTPDKVLNFDEDKTDNFGVLANDVKMLTADEVTATETYASENDLIPDTTYLVKSPSAAITAGDKLYLKSLADGGEYLFRAKTVETNTDGSILIAPAKADDETFGYDLDEFYQFLKVDMNVKASDNPVRNASSPGRKKIDASAEGELNIKFDPKFINTDHFEGMVEIGGKVGYQIDIEWDIKVFGKDYFKNDFTWTTDLDASIDVKIKGGTSNNEERSNRLKEAAEPGEIKILKFSFPTSVVGLKVATKLEFMYEWELNGGFKASGNFKTTHGWKYNTIDGKQKIDKKETSYTAQLEGEGKISFGPKPSVGLDFLEETAEGKLECFFGAKINGKAVIPLAEGGGESIHACRICIEGDINIVFDVGAKLELKFGLKKNDGHRTWELTPIDLKIVTAEWKLFDFYVSLINDSDSIYGGQVNFGKGHCKNKKYRITLNAMKESGEIAPVSIDLFKAGAAEKLTTITSGDKEYLSPGNYVAKAVIDGKNCQRAFSVAEIAKTVTVSSTAGDAHVHGGILDASSKNPVAGAEITAYEHDTPAAITKSSDTGTYDFSLGAGTYKLEIKKDGYVTSIQYITLTTGQDLNLNAMLMAKQDNDNIMGGIHGIIKDATTGESLSGVSIKISHGWGNNGITGTYAVEKTTNESGEYAIDIREWFGTKFGLDAGNYTISISKDGYIPTSFDVTVIGGETMQFDSAITPVGSENTYRIVLTWGENPADLDSHLNGVYAGSRDHIYFSRLQGDGANLDVDDTSSYGPETITIPDISKYTGNIMYSIHDYSNASSESSRVLSESRATVEIYKGSQKLNTFNVPLNTEGTVWNVFYINSSGAIIPVNTFEYIKDEDAVTGRTGI